MKVKNVSHPLGASALALLLLIVGSTTEARPDGGHPPGHMEGPFGPGGHGGAPLLADSLVHLTVGVVDYWYDNGRFYRHGPDGYTHVIAPPGAVIHTLPSGYTIVKRGPLTYYHAAGVYYTWDEPEGAYVVVEAPQIATTTSTVKKTAIGKQFVYPTNGQSAEQQSQDRYECHSWGAAQSGYDPVQAEPGTGTKGRDDYQRAMKACLTARGYSVN